MASDRVAAAGGRVAAIVPRSELRTAEQMKWICDRFKIDGLERLARSTPDYYESKGYYLPDVAALAHAALTELDQLRTAALALADIKLAGDSEPFWEAFLALREALGLEVEASV